MSCLSSICKFVANLLRMSLKLPHCITVKVSPSRSYMFKKVNLHNLAFTESSENSNFPIFFFSYLHFRKIQIEQLLATVHYNTFM